MTSFGEEIIDKIIRKADSRMNSYPGKRMTKKGKIILSVIKYSLMASGLILGFIWFDWKLMLVLFLLSWARGIELRDQILKNIRGE